MADSYAVFKKSFGRYPNLDTVEQFCFDARTKGASGKTKVEVSAGYDYGSFTVKIPEVDLTSSYAAKPTPVPAAKRGIPTVVWLGILILAIVLGLFV